MGWMYSIALKRDVWVASILHYNKENAPYFSKVIFWDDRTRTWCKHVLDWFEPPREH